MMENRSLFICNLKAIFGMGLAILLFNSCNLINPAEPVPSYIRIDSVHLLINDPLKEGSSSHKIKDVWVYVDNQPVGTYEMPAKFPVLNTGTKSVIIDPGILLNGISASRIRYPFFKPYTTTINLRSGEITDITDVTTTYYPGTKFWIEDFEGGISFVPDNGSDTGMVLLSGSSEVFEGTNSAKIYLTPSQTYFKVNSNTSEDFDFLPTNGKQVFLEMNYKNNIIFTVGLTAYDIAGTHVSNDVIALNPKEDWNKIYIELEPTIMNTPNAVKFKIYFTATKASGSDAEILLDNLKVVYN